MIPKVIHYLWIGPYPDSLPFVNDWLNVATDYELKIWDNAETKNYIIEAAELLGLESLKNKHMTYVSDLVRLLILRDHGGVYIDHDFILIKDFSDLLNGKNFAVTYQYHHSDSNKPDVYTIGDTLIDVIDRGYAQSKYHSDTVNNCFIACSKNHSLIHRAIDLLLDNHNKDPKNQFPMSDWGCGPSIFTALLKEQGFNTRSCLTEERNGIIVYECNLLHPFHGVDRQIMGKPEYIAAIDKIKQDKSSYAVHYHEHFGTGMYQKKTLISFYDFYKKLIG